MILEKHIEAYLVREVKKIGGIAEKFVSPGRRSVPDRLVLLPGGHAFAFNMLRPGEVVFVEVKAPGKKPTENQQRDHDRRRAMGFRVEVIDTKEKVDEFIRSVS